MMKRVFYGDILHVSLILFSNYLLDNNDHDVDDDNIDILHQMTQNNTIEKKNNTCVNIPDSAR